MIFEGSTVRYAGQGEKDAPLAPGDQGVVILAGESGSYVHWKSGQCTDYIGLIRNSSLQIVAEESWDTGEVALWLDNDEGLYHAANAITTPEGLKELWLEANPNPSVDVDKVDWHRVYEIHFDTHGDDDGPETFGQQEPPDQSGHLFGSRHTAENPAYERPVAPGHEGPYADQRAHDVEWMTAEEREDYDRHLREVDDAIASGIGG